MKQMIDNHEKEKNDINNRVENLLHMISQLIKENTHINEEINQLKIANDDINQIKKENTISMNKEINQLKQVQPNLNLLK